MRRERKKRYILSPVKCYSKILHQKLLQVYIILAKKCSYLAKIISTEEDYHNYILYILLLKVKWYLAYIQQFLACIRYAFGLYSAGNFAKLFA